MKRWPIKLGLGYLVPAPPPGGSFGPAGTGGVWRWPWIYVQDENDDIWIEWIIFRWLSVRVLVGPDAQSLYCVGSRARDAFDRKHGE